MPTAQTVEITIKVKNNSGSVVETETYSVNYDANGMDLEYEVVEDGGGNPLIRPKERPKY